MWALPVAGGYLTSDYGPRSSPGGVGSTWHRGTDFGGRGTDWLVRSVGPGYVLATGRNAVRGLWVAVRHDDGTTSAYQHLADIRTLRGQRVDGGTVLGRMGQTGTSTATHLHMECFPPARFVLIGDAFASVDRTVDPEPFMLARGVNLRSGSVTPVNNPGGGGGGSVPGAPGTAPIDPITPKEFVMDQEAREAFHDLKVRDDQRRQQLADGFGNLAQYGHNLTVLGQQIRAAVQVATDNAYAGAQIGTQVLNAIGDPERGVAVQLSRIGQDIKAMAEQMAAHTDEPPAPGGGA